MARLISVFRISLGFDNDSSAAIPDKIRPNQVLGTRDGINRKIRFYPATTDLSFFQSSVIFQFDFYLKFRYCEQQLDSKAKLTKTATISIRFGIPWQFDVRCHPFKSNRTGNDLDNGLKPSGNVYKVVFGVVTSKVAFMTC